MGGEEVALLDVRGRDLLGGLHAQQRPDLVAQRGRLLEALAPGRFLHLPAEPLRHLLGAALQEEPRVLARAAVALERAELLDAGRGAALDLVLQARPRAPAVQGLLAGADAEELLHEAGRLPAEARRDVGAAVGVAVLGGATDDVEAGVLLGQGQLQVGVVLVVAEPQVVRRLVALDEVVLEGERLHLAVGDHEVEVGDLLDHAALVQLGRARRLEVRAHAVPQHPRLAHVEDGPVRALEQVDPRPARELLQLVRERHPGAYPCG